MRQTKAIFLDALGTLVELEPPWVGLRQALGEEVTDDRLVAAVRAEMAYYKAHSDEGRDAGWSVIWWAMDGDHGAGEPA